MASLSASGAYLGEKPSPRSSRSKSRSRSRDGRKQQQSQQKVRSYASEGVKDYDIFNLPGSDWSLLAILTVIACGVRLFRIQQPTSVVFDEVQ